MWGLIVTNDKKPTKGKSEPKKKKFPDGTSLKQYGKYKTWTYRRWAWEFLCRKAEFREACDRVAGAGELAESRVAKKFGLAKFKHYADVQTRANVFPVFRDGAIKCISNLESANLEQQVRLAPGQVLIRFKLTSEIDVQAAIEAQIERAKQRLYKLRDEYSKGCTVQAPIGDGDVVAKANSLLLVQYLRILDMQINGIKTAEKIASILYEARPGSIQYEKLDNLSRTTRRNINEANKYPNGLYRYLALRLGRPD